MNTANIKKYAPLARNAFITAVTKRANELGIYDSHVEEANEEGQTLKIEGRSVDLKLKGARNKLISQVESTGFSALMEHVAYTWFNRLCAIRFMELHGYLDHGLRVLSHPDNNSGFEILEHAQDVAEDLGLKRDQIIELKLAGNQDELLYRTLLLGQCHALHKAMPFLFEAIDDETELLLPDNLTRTDSILRGLVNDIPAEDWEQVEVIGWLYQFYISEKKDQVIGKVVKSEDIPAATQLFTPNWIVKYLVQNSVGRQWLQTYPDSSIKAGMEYYIEPAKQIDEVNQQIKAITPASIEPESIKVLDPACGSGHILVEAYQVLKAIYEERGYQPRKIPQLILENNLFGLDIDDRAAQLSGFALMMLARADDKRIFSRDVQLNVMAMQEAAEEVSVEGVALISEEQETALLTLLDLFANAKTFGSLIQVPDALAKRLPELHQIIEEQIDSPDIFAQHTAKVLLPLIKQAEILARKYDVVVANPPYMGSKYQTPPVKKYLKDNFKGYEKDLFSAFIVRCSAFTLQYGYVGLMTPNVWMYISTHEKIRKFLLDGNFLSSLIELPLGGFKGATVQICTFAFQRIKLPNLLGSYIRLVGFKGGDAEMSNLTINAIENRHPDVYFQANTDSFNKIPRCPIAYYLHDDLISSFGKHNRLESVSHSFQGIITGNNEYYLRNWHEIKFSDTKFDANQTVTFDSHKWIPYSKGGAYRKWYGNLEYLIRWNGNDKGLTRARGENKDYYYLEGVSWSDVTSGKGSFRYAPAGGLFDASGPIAFLTNEQVNLFGLIGFMNSKYVNEIAKVLNPTIHFQSENFKSLPYLKEIIQNDTYISNSNRCIQIAKLDWDQFEISWEFLSNQLITLKFSTINDSYDELLINNHSLVLEMEALEDSNEDIFRKTMLFSRGISKSNSLEQITLTVNPKYRYGSKLSDEALDNRFQSDTLAELISYAIGCMMGRYSLDQEGLVYAHAGNEGFTEFVQQGAYKTFPADDDGIIPLTDQEWFADDATHRFREFVRVVWGEDNLQTNLDFVAESLCLHAIKATNSESSLETLRRYLSTKFYKDHLKTYKKRPIYWLFSSGKQKAFECLVYLHRYNESTLSRLRTEYVTPLLGKYEASAMVLEKQMQDASTTAESNRFKKSLTALEKKQSELSDFDDKLKHYADMRISLDLDDGVKVNYGKFGDLLTDVKAVTGKK